MDDQPRQTNLSSRVVLAIIIALVTLVSYFSHSVDNPVTGKKQHITLSVDQEIALGLQAAPQMEAQYGGPDPDPADQARVQETGKTLVSHSKAGTTEYQFAFHTLADDRTINAFALPGGQVFITSGLLHRLKTEGQLAGVLGHEIGHVVARHGAEHLAKQQLTEGLSGAAVIATYDPNNPDTRQNAAIAMALRELVDLKFGRNDELEADRLGVQFSSEAGYDPRAMLEVMEILKQASQGRAPPEFFSIPTPGIAKSGSSRKSTGSSPTAFPTG